MSIKDFLNRIKTIADNHKLVNFTSIDDVYEIWQGGEIKYPAVNIAVENIQYSDDDNLNYLNMILYYGDRLMQDKSNLVDIHTDSTRVLQSIINNIFQINQVGSIDEYIIELWNQQFNDYLAGGYVRLRVGLLSEVDSCSMDKMPDPTTIDIDQNGTYDISDYAIANVSVVDESAQKKIKKLEAEIEGLNIEIDNLNASINADREIVITENTELQTENKLGYNKIIVNVPDTIANVEWLTQVEYDALSEYDKMTLYNITKNDKVVKQYQGDIMIWEKPNTLYNVWKAGDTIVIDTSNIDWNNKGEQSLQTYLTDPAGRYHFIDCNYIEPFQRTWDDGTTSTIKYGLYENRSKLVFAIEEPQPGDYGAAIYQLYDINNDSNRVNNIEVHPEGRYGTWESKSIENDLIKLTAKAVPGGSSRLPILTITFKTDVYEIVDEKPTYTAKIFTHSPWAGQVAEYNYSTIELD